MFSSQRSFCITVQRKMQKESTYRSEMQRNYQLNNKNIYNTENAKIGD